jgi:hypothetical protein
MKGRSLHLAMTEEHLMTASRSHPKSSFSLRQLIAVTRFAFRLIFFIILVDIILKSNVKRLFGFFPIYLGYISTL